MDYQMLVLDIDGTLTNSSKKISLSTKEALLDIQEKGYKVVLASGRPTAGILPLAEELKLKQFGNYILSFNGARIINCRTEEIIYQQTLPRNIIPSLYNEAMKHGVGIITYEGDLIISGTKTDQYIETESKINKIPVKEVKDFTSYVTFDVNKCLMTGEPSLLAGVEKELKNIYHHYLNIYRSEPYFLEIMPQHVDKAHSLLRLSSSLGLTTDQMICCGDGFNDITMLEAAGLGVAMENAQELVKDAANYITSSNDNDGILHVINKFIRNSDYTP